MHLQASKWLCKWPGRGMGEGRDGGDGDERMACACERRCHGCPPATAERLPFRLCGFPCPGSGSGCRGVWVWVWVLGMSVWHMEEVMVAGGETWLDLTQQAGKKVTAYPGPDRASQFLPPRPPPPKNLPLPSAVRGYLCVLPMCLYET